jgi:hypothetical protein
MLYVIFQIFRCLLLIFFLHSFLEATSYIFLILFQKTYLGASLTKIVPVQISILFSNFETLLYDKEPSKSP